MSWARSWLIRCATAGARYASLFTWFFGLLPDGVVRRVRGHHPVPGRAAVVFLLPVRASSGNLRDFTVGLPGIPTSRAAPSRLAVLLISSGPLLLVTFWVRGALLSAATGPPCVIAGGPRPCAAPSFSDQERARREAGGEGYGRGPLGGGARGARAGIDTGRSAGGSSLRIALLWKLVYTRPRSPWPPSPAILQDPSPCRVGRHPQDGRHLLAGPAIYSSCGRRDGSWSGVDSSDAGGIVAIRLVCQLAIGVRRLAVSRRAGAGLD